MDVSLDLTDGVACIRMNDGKKNAIIRAAVADLVVQASAYGSILPAAWSFMLAVGFYEGDTLEPARRLPVSSYIHRNGW